MLWLMNSPSLNLKDSMEFFHTYMYAPLQGKRHIYEDRGIRLGTAVATSDWEVLASLLVGSKGNGGVSGVDLGKLVTAHYLEAKAEPAEYMQAGDDFYMIGTTNPLKLARDIPVLGAGGSCKGDFKMRIGVRSSSSAFYEIQPEIKITNMPKSPYSLKPGTTKKNPFLK